MEEGIQVKSVKIYNLQYHLLRASNPDSITSPINIRQGANLFEKMSSILHVLTSNPNLVGGLRIEIRIRMTLLNNAINFLLECQMFKPESLTWMLVTQRLRQMSTYYVCSKSSELHGQFWQGTTWWITMYNVSLPWQKSVCLAISNYCLDTNMQD